MAGVIVKNIVRGMPEHGYAMLPTFSYIFNVLNPRSINSLMVDEDSGRFIYYFIAFGASIHGYAHMRKRIMWWIEDDASWGFFFKKLKAFVVDEPELKYDLVKLPCAHAMAALRLKHGDEYGTSFYNCSSQVYSKESYLLAYLEPICAAPLELEWSVVREYLGIQVLSSDFDPNLEKRKVKRVKVLKTSRTDRNPGQKFYSCAVGQDNGGCSYFKWIFSDFEVSKFQRIVKFEMLESLRDSEENRNLLMTLYRESEHKIDHLKGLLKDVEIERDQLKHKLAMAEEKE
ncbi:hypothetical protein CQW23_10241 [Capsicum baccatum]|uniref:GRF-type domain-containing protein n=1 Tax=Capsicum baccatum TaxID=33114 RepID=A0A2G2WZ18_CAPBA|nr:hypothetical protein CQW23_10241 [Capsicum baccatum]